jgi:hypothetical protein
MPWGSSHSPAAAALPDAGVVMIAFRDWAVETKGRLWFKVLLTASRENPKDDWREEVLFQTKDTKLECRSPLQPALVGFRLKDPAKDSGPNGTLIGKPNYHFACVYVDDDTGRLAMVLARSQRNRFGILADNISARQFSDVVWEKFMYDMSGLQAPSTALGPSLAMLNEEFFCVYVTSNQYLKCFRAAYNGAGGWREVRFDKPYIAISAPSVVAFNGGLRCIFRDNSGPHKILDYQGGAWREVAELPVKDEDSNSLAMAEWNTSRGPRLVVMGKGPEDNLRYAISADRGKPNFTPALRLMTISSPNGAAMIACGSTLHAFYRIQNGMLNWMVAPPM